MDHNSDAGELGPGGIRWDACPGVWRNPERMSGAWCFDRGRITVSSLFQNIRSGMTLDQYLLVFPMKHEHNVSAVLRHISEQLQGKIGSASESAGAEPGAVDWHDCECIELQSDGRKYNWVFKRTQRPVADLFEHLAGGGCPVGYSQSRPEVRPSDSAGVLSFLIACLDASNSGHADRRTETPSARDDAGEAAPVAHQIARSRLDGLQHHRGER